MSLTSGNQTVATSTADLIKLADDYVKELTKASNALVAFDATKFKEAVTTPIDKNTVRAAVLGDNGFKTDNSRADKLNKLLSKLFEKTEIDLKLSKTIYNIPKSDELLRRFVAPAYVSVKGIPLVDNDEIAKIMQNDTAIPKSDSDLYISLLTITSDDKASFAKWDKRVDEIRLAISQGPAGTPSPISPANIVPNVARNSISVFSSYPAGLREALKQRRLSDQSNPLNASAAIGRIRVVMNGGANNLVGGNASKSAPLYPRFVMHGGAHPLAVMEGGAAAVTTPNPVAVLEARINELKSQFKAVTNQDLDNTLSGQINNYASAIKTNIESVQTSLKELSAANAALAQYPVGLGINPNSMNQQQLKEIAEKADKVNKDAAKAQKQVDKLTAIKDSLEELVNKSNPAPRT